LLKQGYLSTTPESTVRVRVSSDRAMLTVKSKNTGIRRSEFEYEIPMQDAEEMLLLCQKNLIEKTRYTITIGKHIWEIDEFSGANSGLLVAEIELGAEEEPFEKPEWVGEEVSADARYYNSNLVAHPFVQW
jgi:adenylate cyclase